jgi:Concanavalin A-like lectin/glucanases superfamily
MRKPGQIPLTRPAPLDEVVVPVYTESELALIIAEDDPILWMRLNEAGTDEVNEQHFVGEATVNGAPTRLGVGTGFYFDGTDDSVFIGCDQLTNVPARLLEEAGEFTLTALLSSEYVGATGASKIVRWGTYGIELEAYKFSGSDDSGYLRFRFYDDLAATYLVEHYAATLFEPGVQKHVAVTYNGTSLKMFIDGVLVQTEAETAVPHWGYSNTDENGLGIATDGPFGGSFYKGRVGEVAIFGSALSDARILEHAEASRTATLYNVILLDAWATPTGLTSASSFYLTWTGEQDNPDDPTDRTLYTQASAKLTIPATPSVEELYFWALQLSFYDATQTLVAAAHTGLQWAPGYPSSKAVNWGGYLALDDSELTGTVSDLPSELANDNTRDYAWETGTEYTFRVYYIGDDFWRATVNDTIIRDLEVPGATHIANPIFFSEIFAACDDPTHMVKWRDPYLYDVDDVDYYFPQASRSFQIVDGCDNTDSYSSSGYFEMHTNVVRDLLADTDINLRGSVRFEGLFPDSWPGGTEVADEFNWSVEIANFPYVSYRKPLIYTGFEFVDDTATVTDSFLEIQFYWDDTLDVFNTLRISGGYTDNLATYYSLTDEGTALIDVVFQDTDYLNLDLRWVEATTYDLQLKWNAGVWTLKVDGVSVFQFPDLTALRGANMYALSATYQTPCGGSKLKMGLGEVMAVSDAVELNMDTLFVDLDNNDCDDTDAYVADSYFYYENNTTRTLAPGGETLTI